MVVNMGIAVRAVCVGYSRGGGKDNPVTDSGNYSGSRASFTSAPSTRSRGRYIHVNSLLFSILLLYWIFCRSVFFLFFSFAV